VKKYIVLTLGILMFFYCANVYAAPKNPLASSTPVYVKLNEYYLLFTNPAAPFIDSNNRILFPLGQVNELLSIPVAFDQKEKTASLSFSGHNLKIKIDSKDYWLDGQQFSFDSLPKTIDNSIYIPIKLILESFGIKAIWDSQNHILAINDERILQSKTVLYFTGIDGMREFADNQNALLPINSRLTITNYDSEKLWSGILYVQFKNISGETLETKKIDFYHIINFGPYASLQNNYKLPEKITIPNNGVITVPFEIGANDLKGSSLKFILMLGRTLKDDAP
jgi:hypothetical protein